jgi:DedD protein
MAARSSSGKSKASPDPALPQKKRARRRLVGAAAVCLAAAIVLPLVLDSEPRQIRDDVQVRIPSRETPLADRGDASPRADASQPQAGALADGSTPAAGAVREGSDRGDSPAERDAQATQDSRGPGAAAAGGAGREAPAVEAATRVPDPAEPRSAAKVAPPPAADDPIARLAQAKDAGAAKDQGYLVQIGAFSSAKGASEQVERAGKAGHKAFTERVMTAQGERIRVRVGPFATRDAAEQARAKLRSAGLESVLVAP